MSLTDPQIEQYWSSQAGETNPMSPAQYEASLNQPSDAGKAGTPPVVTSEMDAGKLDVGSNPIKLPVYTPPQTPSTSHIPSVAESEAAAAEQADAAMKANPKEQELSTQKTRISDLLAKISGKSTAQAAAEEAQGLPEYNKQLTEITAQIKGLQNEATAIPMQTQNAMEGTGATTFGATATSDRALRTNAIKQLQLATIQSSLTGQIAVAKDNADRAIAAEFGPAETELAYQKELYAMNKDELDRYDKTRSEALSIDLAERTRQLSEQKDNKALILGWTATAAQNNAPTLAINQALAQTDPEAAFSILSPYFVDPMKEKQDIANLEQTHAQTRLTEANIRKINNEITANGLPGVTNPDNAARYAGAISIVTGSKAMTKDQKASFIAAVNSGADPSVVLKNQAKTIMGNDQEKKLSDYETILEQTKTIQSLLQEYYAANGKTDIFKGNFEKVNNLLGQVQDPKLVNIASQIQLSLQAYRNAISGTAYSDQEGQDIASIFPGINKTEGLNNAIMKARLKYSEDYIDTQYRNVLGSAYDVVKTAVDNSAKGDLSNAEFVSQTLQTKGESYKTLLASVPKGNIGAIDNATGDIVSMLPSEFNSAKYTRL